MKDTTPLSAADASFVTIAPKILYFGTPVALVSSVNDDGSTNLAPISSFWTLGWTITLGLLASTHTLGNFRARRDCVVNLPTPAMWPQVERLAPLTGQDPVPAAKRAAFRFVRDKFAAAGFTPVESEQVRAARVKECPVQLEAVVRRIHRLRGDPRLRAQGGGVAAEVEVVRVHVDERLVLRGRYIDPNSWQPLIYNFRHYFGLGQELGKTFRAEI